MSFEQRPIDMKAPILLRPIGDDPGDKRNWVLKAIERTGQPLDDAIHTWAFGFALEDNLMWDSVVEYQGESEARRAHEEIWSRIPDKYAEAARKVFTWASDDAALRPLAGHRRAGDARPARHVRRGCARLLEPRLHRARPPDVACLGGSLRRAGRGDHVLAGLGRVCARLPGRDQGRRSTCRSSRPRTTWRS